MMSTLALIVDINIPFSWRTAVLPELRKVVTFDEDIYAEGGRASNPPLRMIGVAAVVKNPWFGRGFVEDLSPEINRMAPYLGKLITDKLISLAGSGDAIEAYGKACIAGTSCEVEHASALIHTGRFTNLVKSKKSIKKEFLRIKKSSKLAKDIGIEVHAGHGLDYKSTKILSKINEIKEFNIGHFIIGESIFFGFKQVIKKFKKIIK